MLARWTAKQEGFVVQKLDFQITDVRDEQGRFAYWRAAHQDMIEIQQLMLSSEIFHSFTRDLDPASNARYYLAKVPVYIYDFYGHEKYAQAWHVAMMAQIAGWHGRRQHPPATEYQLFIIERPWMDVLRQYLRSHGGHLASLGPVQLRRWAWSKLFAKFKKLNFRMAAGLVRRKIFDFKLRRGLARSKPYFAPEKARIMTEFCGQLNFDDPVLHSDLFFCDGKNLSYEDLLVTFNLSKSPIDAQRYGLLESHHLAAVAMSPQASVVDPSLIEVFRPQRHNSTLPLEAQESSAEYRVLRGLREDYCRTKEQWSQFFKRYNIKLHNSWINYDPAQMAMAEALAELGGISCIYQRSYEPHPCPQLAVCTDIIFSFAPVKYEAMRANYGRFRYHAAVGYVGDYRFGPSQSMAMDLRRKIQAHGAQQIIAYFDENTIDDGRWYMGHKLLRDNYRFWLEQLLKFPTLGLIFKPKVPSTLPRRLGEVHGLLQEAEKTGRCYVFREGQMQGLYPPAVAALAADMAIHDSIISGTAGMESALAGVPTLIMDLEGWPPSPLHQLGKDVVFKDWPQAWQACQNYFKDPKTYRHIGDWSSYKQELDPYQDGKAVERLSECLKWMLEGLRAGRHRDAVMDEVMERFAQKWGKDKVQSGDHHNPRGCDGPSQPRGL